MHPRAKRTFEHVNAIHAIRLGVALCIVGFCCESVQADPCAGWEVRLNGNGPGRLSEHAMNYHAASAKTVLFGGFDDFSVINETWTFDGAAWTQQFPATSPTARRGAAMTWAAGSTDLILFGGEDSSGKRADTWTWNGSTWTQRFPPPLPAPPPARSHAALAGREFGTATRTLLFGGFGEDGTVLNDTYLWGANDTWLSPFPQAPPPPRGAAAMAYDDTRHTTVLFGGADESGNVFGDTWEFDHLQWEWRQVGTVVAPPPRAYHVMAWDSQRQRVVMYGGSVGNVVLSDAWEFDGTTWSPLPASASDGFPNNFAAQIAYDEDSNEFIFYGGSDGSIGQLVTYTRDLSPIAAPVITAHPETSAQSVSGSTLFTVSATGTALSYQWRKDGIALTNDGSVSGATTATLTIDPVGAVDFGQYDVEVTSGCAAVVSNAATLIESDFLPGDHLNPPDQSADIPDDTFNDSNGDGIDGMRVGPIFVSATTGNDEGLGTIEAPMRTIGAAILAAQSRTPIRDVYIAGGEYHETVTLSSGINLYGGYDQADGWSRSSSAASRPIILGGRVAVWAANLTSPTHIDRIEIRSADNYAPGRHTIGLVALNNAVDLQVTNCVIESGDNYGQGRTGARGTNSTGSGSQGGNGGSGACDDLIGGGAGGTPGTGGAGATSGYNGGNGGRGGTFEQSFGFDGQLGHRNFVDVTFGGDGGSRCSVGNPGSWGFDGADGATGTSGSGATALFGVGGTGSTGVTGDGGGGGGGGGGQVNNALVGACQCIACTGGSGNGGGGGGGGGPGGAGGQGGGPGGASMGVFIRGATVNTTSCSITSGNGAPGGAGGEGGFGGSGGLGGFGGSTCLSEVGEGGRGGDGGDGGQGGVGGGGRGGHSFGVFVEFNGAFTPGATTIASGSAGAGGTSGAGGDGSAGEASNTRTLNSAVTDLSDDAPLTAAYALIVTDQDTPATPVDPVIADADPGDTYEYTITDAASHGTASIVSNQLGYTPDPGFIGLDAFRFRATQVGGDGYVYKGIAVIIVNPNPAPSATNDSPTCPGDSLQLSATEYTGAFYAWSGPEGVFAIGREPVIPELPLGGGGTYVAHILINGLWVEAETLVTELPSPVITQHPQSQSVDGGAQALFTVATAATNPTYQWRKDGSPLVNDAIFSGVQTDTLTIDAVATAQLGQYDVVVTDGCSIVSDAATLSLTIACSSTQPRLYVDANITSGICGNGWDDAYASIQPALERASTNGLIVEIWVARGTYATSGEPFELHDGLSLIGGFAGNETSAAQRYIAGNETILDGQTTTYHVIKCESGSPVLDGFTITNGNASGGFYDAVGGGMFVNQASPIVRNCRFTNNYAIGGGGAIRAGTSGTPMELVNCTFENNTTQTTQPGGAIRMVGGRLLVDRCTFTGGIAAAGGAIWQQGGQMAVANSIFQGNETHGPGGGSAIGTRGSLDMINCTLTANTNSGSGQGALNAQSSSSVRIDNSIFWENDFSMSEQDQIRSQGAFVDVYNSTISGLSSYWGNNNSDADPGFANPPSDLRLTVTSSALDNADNAPLTLTGPFSGIVLDYDRDGRSRILYGAVDRGAYEYGPQIPFDADGDGDVDFIDARAFDACLHGPAGGLAAGCAEFDADADGHVTLADFASFQMNFTGSN